jgi:hypothetical protein
MGLFVILSDQLESIMDSSWSDQRGLLFVLILLRLQSLSKPLSSFLGLPISGLDVTIGIGDRPRKDVAVRSVSVLLGHGFPLLDWGERVFSLYSKYSHIYQFNQFSIIRLAIFRFNATIFTGVTRL